MRIRGAGIISYGDGFILMHRNHVEKTPGTNKPYGEYYVIPGGGLEENETIEECVVREIEEEAGIQVEVLEKIFEEEIDGQIAGFYYRCKYLSGVIGTGKGPEFSDDPNYKHRGTYEIEIIPKTEIKNIRLIPEGLKEKLVQMIENDEI